MNAVNWLTLATIVPAWWLFRWGLTLADRCDDLLAQDSEAEAELDRYLRGVE